MTARLRNLRHRSLKGLNRSRLDHMSKDLANGDWEPGSPLVEYVFTADNTTDQITVSGEDTLAADLPRVSVYGDDLPLGLEGGILYWLADAGTDVYTLHTSKSDASAAANPVNFTDDGTGTHTMIVYP